MITEEEALSGYFCNGFNTEDFYLCFRFAEILDIERTGPARQPYLRKSVSY